MPDGIIVLGFALWAICQLESALNDFFEILFNLRITENLTDSKIMYAYRQHCRRNLKLNDGLYVEITTLFYSYIFVHARHITVMLSVYEKRDHTFSKEQDPAK